MFPISVLLVLPSLLQGYTTEPALIIAEGKPNFGSGKMV